MQTSAFENPQDSYELVALFRYVSRLLARAYHTRQGQGERGHHARHAQDKVLALVREKGPISQAELQELLDLRSSSLSELLGKLQDKGFIERERSETDRRSFTVTATRRADELLASQEASDRETAEQVFACLNSVERESLHGLLGKVVESLQESFGPAGPEGESGHRRGRKSGKRRKHGGRQRRR